jgi:hypothetical protein
MILIFHEIIQTSVVLLRVQELPTQIQHHHPGCHRRHPSINQTIPLEFLKIFQRLVLLYALHVHHVSITFTVIFTVFRLLIHFIRI